MLNNSYISKKSYDYLHYRLPSFSKLSHGHFSANITKFSEQLSLTPFSSYTDSNGC